MGKSTGSGSHASAKPVETAAEEEAKQQQQQISLAPCGDAQRFLIDLRLARRCTKIAHMLDHIIPPAAPNDPPISINISSTVTKKSLELIIAYLENTKNDNLDDLVEKDPPTAWERSFIASIPINDGGDSTSIEEDMFVLNHLLTSKTLLPKYLPPTFLGLHMSADYMGVWRLEHLLSYRLSAYNENNIIKQLTEGCTPEQETRMRRNYRKGRNLPVDGYPFLDLNESINDPDQASTSR